MKQKLIPLYQLKRNNFDKTKLLTSKNQAKMSDGISWSMTRKELESTGVYQKLSEEKKKELKKLTKGPFFEALKKEADKGERKSPRKSPVKEIEIKSLSEHKDENVTIIVNLITDHFETNDKRLYSNPNYLSEDDNFKVHSVSESNAFYLTKQESKAEKLIDLLYRWKKYAGVVVNSEEKIILTTEHGVFGDKPVTITEEEISVYYKDQLGFFRSGSWTPIKSGKIPCDGSVLFFQINVLSLVYNPKRE
jgi:hypothetical protein